jgi:predicted enzyme related to lactoylglutathione lyase
MGEATYTVFEHGGEDVAGMLGITPRMVGVMPGWVTYFTVEDAEAAARKAVALGGTVSMSMKEVPTRRFCGITSPQGVGFRVVQYAR